MIETPNYEFYVIHYNMNKRECEMWNIFNNWVLSEDVFTACKKHLRHSKDFSFEDLKEWIRKSIHWQEWSRVEYEISVGDPFPEDTDKFKKVDAYWQALPNIELITSMCIKKTRDFLREKKKEKEND